MSDKTIEAEIVPPTQALAVRDTQTGSLGRPMTVEELHAQLEFVRQVMRQEMKQGQDYGKVPGCGDKPSLFQPGAQKLLMTFNLCETVKREEVRDHQTQVAGHREYAFTITVKAVNGKEWDGVGTCSTLESKYRYRQQDIRCPHCGKPYVRKSKQGGGWYCWAKLGGCGANFPADAPAIISQPRGRVEHDNPADFWNTVRKMAFKRALVAGTINATNTSELWTQDVEDNAHPEEAPEPPENPPSSPATAPATAKPPSKAIPPTKPAPEPASTPLPTPESLRKMIVALKAGPGEPNRDIVTEYFRKCTNPTPLMPKEELEALELRFVPATTGQMKKLAEQIARFGNGDRAELAFPPHFDPLYPTPEAVKTPAQVLPNIDPKVTQDPLWWRNIIITVPRKGMKKADYEKKPDTIGALYDKRHGNDEESEAARSRLFGMTQWEPKPREWQGKTYQPTEADWKCYRALQSFRAWFEANHPGEKI